MKAKNAKLNLFSFRKSRKISTCQGSLGQKILPLLFAIDSQSRDNVLKVNYHQLKGQIAACVIMLFITARTRNNFISLQINPAMRYITYHLLQRSFILQFCDITISCSSADPRPEFWKSRSFYPFCIFSTFLSYFTFFIKLVA